VVDGNHYELDCLIYATGFEVGTDYARRAGYQLFGRNGLTLSQKWGDGVRTLHGIHMHGFPNCFMLSVAQSGFTVNFPYMINEQAKHVAYIVHRALDKGFRTLEVAETAESEWVDAVIARSDRTVEFSEHCTPGYYNNEGKPGRIGRQNGFYFGGPMEFAEILAEWRADGAMKGLERT
jgi:cyclohexanone monooxygenase